MKAIGSIQADVDRGDVIPLHVVLILRGAVVAGTMVPYVQYRVWLNERLSRGLGADPDDIVLRDATIRHSAKEDVPPEGEDAEVACLKDASVILGGNTRVSVPYMLVQVSEVSGFTFGSEGPPTPTVA